MINILIIIIAITCIVSFQAFKDRDLLYKLSFMPYRVENNKESYRFFTNILVHGDTFHLLFNMISLYFLGSVLLNQTGGLYIDNDGATVFVPQGMMQEYGSMNGQIRFLILYVLGGVFATLLPFMRNRNNPNYLSMGASGAVSAVIFAAIIWNPTMKLYLFFIPIGIPAYIFGPLYIAYEIFMDKRGNTGIAHDAHLGGAIFGILFVLFSNIEFGKRFIEQIFN